MPYSEYMKRCLADRTELTMEFLDSLTREKVLELYLKHM